MSKRTSKADDRNFELISLGRASYASHSAISSLTKHLKEHGLPEASSRSSQYRARKDICRQREGDYGPLIVDKELALANGEPQQVSFQNPFAWLQYNCLHSTDFAAIVQAAVRAHPCTPSSPWRLILYQDGVDPSDGLAKNHSRKSAVYYWSFVELGLRALSMEEVWGTLICLRYQEYTKLAGKHASLFDAVLDQFFSETHHFRKTGCSLKFPNGERVLLLAKPSVLLADLPALAECLSCKGHAGLMCCPACTNCTPEVGKMAVPLHLLTEKAVSIATTDYKAFTKHTNASIRHVCEKLNVAHERMLKPRGHPDHITKEAFEELEVILGWNWTPCNSILNPRFDLGIASMLMFDGAHIYVHDGLLDNEFGALMKKFSSARSKNASYNELADYLECCTFPKNAPKLAHLFSDSAIKNNLKSGGFTCTGSQMLTLAPVLKDYLQRIVHPRGQFLEHVESLIAVLEVIELLQSVKTGTVHWKDLDKAIIKHLVLFKSCYGAVAFKPKHHYALHLGPMLKHHGFLLMTFVHERKHRLVTRYTRDRKNLKAWSAGAIEEITCHQIWELSQPFFGACRMARLQGTITIALLEMFPGTSADDFTVLNGLGGNGGCIDAGDVVSCIHDGTTHLGQLVIAVGLKRANTHESHAVIALWEPTADNDVAWPMFKVSGDNITIVPLTLIDTVFLYRLSADMETCRVYMPLEVRPK